MDSWSPHYICAPPANHSCCKGSDLAFLVKLRVNAYQNCLDRQTAQFYITHFLGSRTENGEYSKSRHFRLLKNTCQLKKSDNLIL